MNGSAIDYVDLRTEAVQVAANLFHFAHKLAGNLLQKCHWHFLTPPLCYRGRWIPRRLIFKVLIPSKSSSCIVQKFGGYSTCGVGEWVTGELWCLMGYTGVLEPHHTLCYISIIDRPVRIALVSSWRTPLSRRHWCYGIL